MSNDDKYSLIFPHTEEELLRHLRDILKNAAGYNGSARAMVDAAHVAFNYAAAVGGVTGFQANWAQLTFIGEQRGLKAPFMLVDSQKLMFPQYNLMEELEEFLDNSKPAVAVLAKESLEDGRHMNDRVREHMETLVKHYGPETEKTKEQP